MSTLRMDVVTIFPDYLRVLDLSLIGKAADSGLLELAVHDLRSWTNDPHRTVDDTPIGGGAGMVMKADVWGRALDEVMGHDLHSTPTASQVPGGRQVLVIPTPSGEVFTQRIAEDLAGADQIIFACGRYEGIDARVGDYYASQGVEVRELSIGDYVLNGGEVAALVMIEAIARLRPGVLGNPESIVEESHSSVGLLEYENYTRPVEWRGLDVSQMWPSLMSGDHARIARLRRDRAIARTAARRPDMIERLSIDALDSADRVALARQGWLAPTGASRPIQYGIRPAIDSDIDALSALAARTFPDACPPFLSEEEVRAHISTHLNRESVSAWIAHPDAVVTVAYLDEDLVIEGRCRARAGDLVGYSLLIREPMPDADPAPGLDPCPRAVRRVCPADAVIGELSKMYVDDTMRGSGLAQLLLAEVVCDASTSGIDGVWLGTHERNRRAQKAYKRAGFKKVGSRFYEVGGQQCRDVVMYISCAQVRGHAGVEA